MVGTVVFILSVAVILIFLFSPLYYEIGTIYGYRHKLTDPTILKLRKEYEKIFEEMVTGSKTEYELEKWKMAHPDFTDFPGLTNCDGFFDITLPTIDHPMTDKVADQYCKYKFRDMKFACNLALKLYYYNHPKRSNRLKRIRRNRKR